MDISKIELPETAKIHIEHPTLGKLYADDDTKKLPMTIEVYGPASKAATEFKRKATKRMSERLGRKGMKAFSQIPPEELEEIEVEKLVAMTASVSNMTMSGKPVTAANVAEVYGNPSYGWIRDQVAEKIGSWEDFLG